MINRLILMATLIIFSIGCHTSNRVNETKNTVSKTQNMKPITDKKWTLIELTGQNLSEEKQEMPKIHFSLNEDNNRITGFGGCNNFSGNYTLAEGNKLSFSQVVSTKKACFQLNKESEFFQVLNTVDNYTLHDGVLSLNRAKMAPLAKFKVMEMSENTANLGENEYIYWVNSAKVDCVGVGPQTCYQIQKADLITANNWQLFYSSIEGFKYEPGFIYQLVVKEKKLPKNQVPADASSIKYSLVKILNKQVDSKLRLHDIWALEQINGKEINLENLRRPQIELNLTQMKMMGNDGCNELAGNIDTVTSEVLTFGAIAGTKKACMNMEVPNTFNLNLSYTKTYKIKGLKLFLMDEKGEELLRFQKID